MLKLAETPVRDAAKPAINPQQARDLAIALVSGGYSADHIRAMFSVLDDDACEQIIRAMFSVLDDDACEQMSAAVAAARRPRLRLIPGGAA